MFWGQLWASEALALLFGSAAPRYVKTAVHHVRGTVDDSVPIEFKIEAARQEVADLEPAIHKNIEAIAKAEVDVEYLENEIAATRDNLDREAKALVALRQHLNDGDLKLTGSVSYTPDEIMGEMARRMDHYKNIKTILATKEDTLKQKKAQLVAFREQNARMRAEKLALMTKLEGIETRLKQIEATQASNEFNFDDSALAQAKQAVAELDKKLQVMARVAEQEGRFSDRGLPLPVEPGRDILHEIDSEFGTPSDHPNAGKDL